MGGDFSDSKPRMRDFINTRFLRLKTSKEGFTNIRNKAVKERKKARRLSFNLLLHSHFNHAINLHGINPSHLSSA